MPTRSFGGQQQLKLLLECVPMKISYHLIFNNNACYITSQWHKFRIKNATLYLHILFWHFFVVFIKICVFVIFIFFGWSMKSPQQNINQSETAVGDKKLSEGLYVSEEERRHSIIRKNDTIILALSLSKEPRQHQEKIWFWVTIRLRKTRFTKNKLFAVMFQLYFI